MRPTVVFIIINKHLKSIQLLYAITILYIDINCVYMLGSGHKIFFCLCKNLFIMVTHDSPSGIGGSLWGKEMKS